MKASAENVLHSAVVLLARSISVYPVLKGLKFIEMSCHKGVVFGHVPILNTDMKSFVMFTGSPNMSLRFDLGGSHSKKM